MIYYGGRGAFFDRDTRVHTADGKAYVIHSEFVNDFENEDFNNAYYVVTIIVIQEKRGLHRRQPPF